MRIVFFGTPEFAAVSLRALLRERFTVTGVVTQPDRPQGRSRSTLVPPPVKALAVAEGLPVLQPARPVGDLFLAALRRLEPDIGVVVAYGHILRPELLSVPPRGMINVHASLLPRFRGAAPIQHAILEGDSETGVSIMVMEAGLDSGPVIHRVATPVQPEDTGGTLTARLAELGAGALIEALSLVAAGAARPQAQHHALATFAPKVDRAAARIDWSRDAEAIARQIRAFDPAPGAWTTLGEEPVKLFSPRVSDRDGEPGAVLAAGERLVIGCGTRSVMVREVQPSGRARMTVEAWVRGRGIAAGRQLA
jgi:methionyl-tRNA formyltransferase